MLRRIQAVFSRISEQRHAALKPSRHDTRHGQTTLSTPGMVTSISNLRSGQIGSIAYLEDTTGQDYRKLISMGFITGTMVKLMQKTPSFLILVGKTQFAIDRKIADSIYVYPEENCVPACPAKRPLFRSS